MPVRALCVVLLAIYSCRAIRLRHSCLLSHLNICCTRPLLRHMRSTVTSVLRRSFNSRKGAHFIQMNYLGQRCDRFHVRVQRLFILCCDEGFLSLTAILFNGQKHSPTLRQDTCLFQATLNPESVHAHDVRFVLRI